MPNERTDLMELVFTELQNLEPEAMSKVNVLMSDITQAFDTSFKNVTGRDDVLYNKCSWHLEERWKRRLKDALLLDLAKQMRTSGRVQEFDNLFQMWQDLADPNVAAMYTMAKCW